MKYDISTLVTAVNDYLYEENEFRTWWNTTMKDKHNAWYRWTEDEKIRYTKYEQRTQYTGCEISHMCKLVGIDETKLTGMVKAINRWEKHNGKWDREYCIHPDGYRNDDRVRKYLDNDSDRVYFATHYRSTYRKISA